MSQRAQFPVRKRGTVATGSWSTRTLTIDTATGTVTVSRKNHPNNVLYHSMEVRWVQMWPRFDSADIDEKYHSLPAKMTIKVIGKEVPVPHFTAAVTGAARWSPPSTPGANARGPADMTSPPPPPPSAEFACVVADPAKKPRPLITESTDNLYECWLLRFTSIEAYAAAVGMLGMLRQRDGAVCNVLGEHAASDLDVVKGAWAAHYTTRSTTAEQRAAAVL